MSTSSKEPGRIEWEKDVVSDMINLYCRKRHNTPKGELCRECADLLSYSLERLDRCRYGEEKPTCKNCPTHCYRPVERERIRAVMRFSGLRLFLRAPVKWMVHAFHDRVRLRAIEQRKIEGEAGGQEDHPSSGSS